MPKCYGYAKNRWAAKGGEKELLCLVWLRPAMDKHGMNRADKDMRGIQWKSEGKARRGWDLLRNGFDSPRIDTNGILFKQML